MAIVARAVLPGEPDLLKGKEHQALVFTDLDHNHLYTTQAPVGGWTHDGLEKAGADVNFTIQQNGWDAYLSFACSDNWIGSSEV